MNRVIGIAGVQCFDGPCDPWTKAGCVSCAVRPMKVYTGNDGKISAVRMGNEYGWGMFHSARYRPRDYPYHALDNGAFPSWVKGEKWNPEPFVSALVQFEVRGPRLDFAVVPDIVAGGLESLARSMEWLPKLETTARKYLAVQDGMTLANIEPVLGRFGGLFVGGTASWKLQTGEEWVALAHKHNLPCHIGRIGTWDKIVWASRIGADSIDSTSWARNNSYHHLKDAQIQRLLSVVGRTNRAPEGDKDA